MIRPIVNDFELLAEFSYDQLAKSVDLQSAVDSGYITLEDEDSVILNSIELLNSLILYLVCITFYIVNRFTSTDLSAPWSSSDPELRRTYGNSRFFLGHSISFAFGTRPIQPYLRSIYCGTTLVCLNSMPFPSVTNAFSVLVYIYR